MGLGADWAEGCGVLTLGVDGVGSWYRLLVVIQAVAFVESLIYESEYGFYTFLFSSVILCTKGNA